MSLAFSGIFENPKLCSGALWYINSRSHLVSTFFWHLIHSYYAFIHYNNCFNNCFNPFLLSYSLSINCSFTQISLHYLAHGVTRTTGPGYQATPAGSLFMPAHSSYANKAFFFYLLWTSVVWAGLHAQSLASLLCYQCLTDIGHFSRGKQEQVNYNVCSS